MTAIGLQPRLLVPLQEIVWRKGELLRAACIVAVLASLAWMFPGEACGQSPPAESSDAVEAGKEALSEVARFPWYDQSQDEVRRLNVRPRDDADSRNRNSQWTRTPGASTGGNAGRRSMSVLGPALQWVGITALILLLGVIAFLVARAFLTEEISDAVEHRKVVETRHDVDRVEELPFQVRRPSGDFLSEARHQYEAGYYSEAIIYLFSYQLVQLDKHHLLRLAKGKTNRQYLREVRQRPVARSILEQTMVAFEDAFFGRKSLSREQFEACWQRVDEFHRELQSLERAAA